MISGAANKAVAEVAKQMADQAMEQVKTGASKFDEVMAQAAQAQGGPNQVPSVNETVELNKTGKINGMETVQNILRSVENGQMQVDKIMDMAMSGREFNPQELFAIQAGVFRFTQELELTGKVIEQATSGIKTTMQTQV